MRSMEESLNKIKNLLFEVNPFYEKSTNSLKEKGSTSHGSLIGDKSQQAIPPLKQLKMDFLPFYGDDHIEWLNRVTQFFEYQETEYG